jgi:hypothetical protein
MFFLGIDMMFSLVEKRYWQNGIIPCNTCAPKQGEQNIATGHDNPLSVS